MTTKSFRLLTLLALALLGCNAAMADDEGTVTESIFPTCDVQVRSDNKSYNKSDGTAIEMRTTVDADGNVTADFVGLMSFDIPVKVGYSVKSATLRLVTERVKAGGLSIYALNGAISSSDTYTTQEENIKAARNNTAIISTDLKGTSGRAAFDSQAEGTSYDDWKNELDITSAVQAMTDGKLNLLLCNKTTTTGKEGVNVYTDEASATTITEKQLPKFTFEENALRPMLTIIYNKVENSASEGIYPTYDLQLRSDGGNASKNTNNGTALELRTTVTSATDNTVKADFVGLMSFAIPQKEGYTIKSATLRLVTERKKNGSLSIYNLGSEITNDDTYTSQSENITKARAGEPIVKQFTVKGTNNKATFDTGMESTTLADWTNTIELPVSALTGTTLNLLLSNGTTTTGNQGVNFYTKDATKSGLTSKNQAPKFECEDADLWPLLTIVYERDGHTMTFATGALHDGVYCGTLNVGYTVEIPEGVNCYTAKAQDNEKVTLAKVEGTLLPAQTPVYVTSTESGEVKFYKSGYNLSALSDNLFKGTLEATTVSAKSVLTLGHEKTSNELGFWPFNGTTLPANKAYLEPVSAQSKGVTLSFEGDATGIEQIDSETVAQDDAWYTLQGIRLQSRPTEKGIYIHNHKTVTIR